MAGTEIDKSGVIVETQRSEEDQIINFETISSRVDELINNNPKDVEIDENGSFVPGSDLDRLGREPMMVDGVLYSTRTTRVKINGDLQAEMVEYAPVNPNVVGKQKDVSYRLFGSDKGKKVMIWAERDKEVSDTKTRLTSNSGINVQGDNPKILRSWGSDEKLRFADKFRLPVPPEVVARFTTPKFRR